MHCAEKAFDADNKLKQSKSLSINKVGHGMLISLPVLVAYFPQLSTCLNVSLICFSSNVCELGRFTCTRSLLNPGFVISVILFTFAGVFHPALHDLDPVFRDFSRSEKVSALAASLGYKRPAPIQSMYIYKV